MGITEYIKKIFEDKVLVIFGAAWATFYKFAFPEVAYAYAAGAVLGIMILDLLTKLYALSKQDGGIKKAISTHRINSAAFAKGTLDKLLVFGVMLIICGFAYRISPISNVAVWFIQTIFTLMFLRDVLSIIENLSDAGVGGLGMFKKLIKNKADEYGVDISEGKDHEDH